MPSAEALVPTARAARYVDQLCSHLGAMRHLGHLRPIGHGPAGTPRVEGVERHNDTLAVIRFAEGSCRVEAREDGFNLRVDAGDAASLERIKNGIAGRVATIGRRDGLTVAWSSPSDAPAPSS